MVDVFISYPRAQRSKVEPIKERLEAHGLEVFFDVQGIDGGADFPDVIDKKLRACKAVLSCWSPIYFQRRWCLIECRSGLDKNALLPVAIERFAKDAPPADLRNVHYYNLIGWSGAEDHEDWLRALAGLGRLVGKDLIPTASKVPSGPAASSTRSDGQSFRVTLKGVPDWPAPEMVVIPRGRFLMGASEYDKNGAFECEYPQHEVRIDHDLAFGRYAVSFAEWDAAHRAGAPIPSPGDEGWGRGNRPVINIGWRDAQSYIAWLNKGLGLAGKRDAYRLPTEAEWEYACRAGTATPFNWGRSWSHPDYANYDWSTSYGAPPYKGTPRRKTLPGGSFPANQFGLHDMHGNVWEWCEDIYHENYANAPADGSAWLTGKGSRISRGGSWMTHPNAIRSAHRTSWAETYHGNTVGFRLARTL